MSGDSPLEHELLAHIQITQWDQRDLEAATLAIHRVTCPAEPCTHAFDDIDKVDQDRAHAAIDALRTTRPPARPPGEIRD
jgi:hypothetical protein